MDLLFWAAAALVAAALGGWRAVRSRGRARQLMLLCHRADLEFFPVDPFPDTLWLPFRWLGGGRWIRAENVVWNRAEPDARAFDLLVEEESANEDLPRAVRRNACAAVAMPFGCLRLEVRPREAAEWLVDAFGGPDIEMELDAFNRRFRVRSDDRRFAVAFCDQRMMRAMLGLPEGVTVAVNEDRMLLRAASLTPAEMLLLLEAARAMKRAVPTVVASLYPPRPAKGRHEDRWFQGHWSPESIGDDVDGSAAGGASGL